MGSAHHSQASLRTPDCVRLRRGVVRIHLDRNFNDIPQLANYTSSLFTITSYFPKILNAILVKSEKVKILNAFAFRIFGGSGWIHAPREVRSLREPSHFMSLASPPRRTDARWTTWFESTIFTIQTKEKQTFYWMSAFLA